MSRRGGGDWERGATYLIGEWIINFDELDKIEARLKKLQPCLSLKFDRFDGPVSPKPTVVSSSRCKVFSFVEEKQKIASRPKNNEEKIKRAYRDQRRLAEIKIKSSMIEKFRKKIIALDILNLPEIQNDLAAIKQDLEGIYVSVISLPPPPLPEPAKKLFWDLGRGESLYAALEKEIGKEDADLLLGRTKKSKKIANYCDH